MPQSATLSTVLGNIFNDHIDACLQGGWTVVV